MKGQSNEVLAVMFRCKVDICSLQDGEVYLLGFSKEKISDIRCFR